MEPTPQIGKHGFSGSYMPTAANFSNTNVATFSVGLFKWVAKKGGKGCKSSAILIRVKGYCSQADEVYAKARELCAKLDNGWTPPLTRQGMPKTISVTDTQI